MMKAIPVEGQRVRLFRPTMMMMMMMILSGVGLLLFSCREVSGLSTSTGIIPTARRPGSGVQQKEGRPALSTPEGRRMLTGNWIAAKRALQRPDCCVVKVSGLERHLQVLQDLLVGNDDEQSGRMLTDVDLRSRIRGAAASFDSSSHHQFGHSEQEGNKSLDMNDDICLSDCRRVLDSILVPITTVNVASPDDKAMDAGVAALEELARGIASLAPAQQNNNDRKKKDKKSAILHNDDVHMRIVSASSYRAVDPMFHTDKCLLRGYVTVCGVGTEYMTRPCTSPFEYLYLRSFGLQHHGEPSASVRKAQVMEFIVMKGDYYPPPKEETTATTMTWLLSKFWPRTYACVHRSPPGDGRRRVIVSFDLADGDDDREWYEAGHRREWRSGMTQRKSRLVA
jgi:hypothetical protein